MEQQPNQRRYTVLNQLTAFLLAKTARIEDVLDMALPAAEVLLADATKANQALR